MPLSAQSGVRPTRLITGFLAEDRRKTSAKYVDYADLKAKAKATEYDQLSESQKSELQKVIDRATAAEKERDDLRDAEKGVDE